MLKYFNEKGIEGIRLTILIMMPNCTTENAVELEQYCMDILKPNLNVDPVAKGTGYHEPMSQYWRDQFRKARGTKVFIYDRAHSELVFISDRETRRGSLLVFNSLQII